MRPVRREMQMIFQDPYSSLNPRQTVGQIIGAALHDPQDRGRHAQPWCSELMDRCGMNPEHYNRYPHEFSGGQRQRIGLARALALQPQADRLRRAGVGARRLDPGADPEPAREPAERVRPHLRLHLARSLGDPPDLRSDRGDVPRPHRRARRLGDLYSAPRHPYTASLLSAVPRADRGGAAKRRERIVLGRRRAVPGRAAIRLRVPSALPQGAADDRGQGRARGLPRRPARARGRGKRASTSMPRRAGIPWRPPTSCGRSRAPDERATSRVRGSTHRRRALTGHAHPGAAAGTVRGVSRSYGAFACP